MTTQHATRTSPRAPLGGHFGDRYRRAMYRHLGIGTPEASRRAPRRGATRSVPTIWRGVRCSLRGMFEA